MHALEYNVLCGYSSDWFADQICLDLVIIYSLNDVLYYFYPTLYRWIPNGTECFKNVDIILDIQDVSEKLIAFRNLVT